MIKGIAVNKEVVTRIGTSNVSFSTATNTVDKHRTHNLMAI